MKWLDSMVLRKKLILVSAIFSIGLLVSGAIAYIGVNRWSDEMHVISEQRLPIMVALAEVDHERMVIRAQTFEVWRYKNSADPADKFLTILDGRKKSWENIDKTWMVIDEFHPKTDEGKKAKEELIPLYKEWREIYVELDRILGEMAASHNPAHQELLFKRYEEAVNRMVGISDGMGKSIDGFTAINQRNTIAMVNNAKEDAEHYTLTMIVTVLTILAVALTVGYMISASISRSISQSVIAIRDGAMQITSASDQVAASSSSLAQGASEQASSVEQVSATLKENTAINAQNVDNARQADILAKNANDAAHAGFDKGEELSRSMNTITESATKISGIIKTIDQIAFQTNLLALNAAVEAARAGEHGLGFAVVADEVRNLAQRAASAAKETSVIIEGVVSQIKEGNKIVETTRDSFKEIVDQSKKVSDLIGEIAISGKEQSEGLSEINLAMNQVDQVTQQVAANSEEAAAAAEELNAQAVSMMETVRLLAAVVGMENENGMIRKHSFHDKHHDPHTTHAHPSPHPKSVSKAEEIFPLHEDDLKEF